MVLSKVGAAGLLAIGVDLGELLLHALLEGRLVVAVLDLVEAAAPDSGSVLGAAKGLAGVKAAAGLVVDAAGVPSASTGADETAVTTAAPMKLYMRDLNIAEYLVLSFILVSATGWPGYRFEFRTLPRFSLSGQAVRSTFGPDTPRPPDG